MPIVIVFWLNGLVKDDPNISELGKVFIAVGPAVVLINIVICTYAFKAMKDPENYEVDPPLKIKLRPKKD